MDLASKYRPSSLQDVVGQETVVDILKNTCQQGLINRNFLFIGPAGTGKAQPLSSNVLTTSGYKCMGNVHVGDEVFTSYGNRALVSAIYPQGYRDVYRITLKEDNVSFEVADNHLNEIHWYDEDVEQRVDGTVSTIDLIDLVNTSKWQIKVDTPEVEWEDKKVPIDPYILGVFRGYTCMYDDFQGCNVEEYVVSKIDSIFRRDWECTLDIENKSNIYIRELPNSSLSVRRMRKYKLQTVLMCMHKYNKVPDVYIYNSKNNRLRFLQGLFDVAASYSYDSEYNIKFTTSNKTLVNQVTFICRSLGIQVRMESTTEDYKVENTLEYYTVSVKAYQKDNHDLCLYDKMDRSIASIEYIGKKPCQCIMVDHSDHTYITDGFVPTHNTTLARCLANELNGSLASDVIEVDAASYSGVDSMRELVKQMQSYPLKGKYKVFILDEVHSFSNAAWQSALKTLESPPARTVTCLCTTNPEKIPATILSRVQTFQLSKIRLDDIIQRLIYILNSEGYKEGTGDETYTVDAVTYIGKMAQGGLRDSITLLTKVLTYSSEVNIENVKTALNLPDYDEYFNLLNYLVSKNNAKIIETIDRVYNSGVNFVEWFSGLHSFTCNIIKYICLKDISKTMIPSTYEDKLIKYSDTHLAVCLRWSQRLLELVMHLKGTQYLQETAITYLCSIPNRGK